MEVTRHGSEGATQVAFHRLRINGGMPEANTTDSKNRLLVEEPQRCCLDRSVTVAGQKAGI